MLRSTSCALAGALTALLMGSAATAAAQGLTLQSAIEQTLARNPELRVYAPRLTAARERAAVAALRPPFELQAETQDAFGTGRASGFDSAETTFALSQVVELGGKRGLRVDAADATAAVVDAERAAAELDVLAEVTRRLIHVAADQEHLQLTMRGLDEDIEIPPETAIAMFRTAQEAIANVIKHADATRLEIEASVGDRLTLRVADDGTGLPEGSERKTGSHGLKQMRFRMESVGGRIRIEPNLPRGTALVLSVPLA
jgi:hypothetical protein